MLYKTTAIIICIYIHKYVLIYTFNCMKNINLLFSEQRGLGVIIRTKKVVPYMESL